MSFWERRVRGHAFCLIFVVGFWPEKARELIPLLKSNIAKTLMAEGVSAAEVQKRGNVAYQSLGTKELESYQKRADDANSNSGQESAVSRTKLVRKIISNIHANVSIQLLSMLR